MKEGKIMSDSTRIKVTVILGVLGFIGGIILGIVAFSNGEDSVLIIILAFIGLVIGIGLVSVPLTSGWIWRKTAVIRNFGPIGLVIGLLLWYFIFAFSLLITPIISIYKFVTAKRDVRTDKEYELQKEQLQIESASNDWRDHF
jgi:uncharacterized membrane protein